MKNNSKLSTNVSCLIALGLAAILVMAPIKNAIAQRQDYLPFFTKAGWLFVGIAAILIIEGKSIWQIGPELALLALAAFYGLTIFWARDKSAAIDGALTNCVYLGIFLTAKYVSRNKTANMLLRWSLAASGVVACGAGLFTAAGLGASQTATPGGRIYGTLQYPDALPAYAIFTWFILLHAWLELDNLDESPYRTLGNFLAAISAYVLFLVIHPSCQAQARHAAR